MVKHYMADPLTDVPEDKKEIARSKKKASRNSLKPRKVMGVEMVGSKGGQGKTIRDLTHVWSMVGESGLLSRQPMSQQ